jgi:hypothetical protein
MCHRKNSYFAGRRGKKPKLGYAHASQRIGEGGQRRTSGGRME